MFLAVASIPCALAVGCGHAQKDQSQQASCKLEDPVTSCANGQVCESVAGAPACVAPLVVAGKVADPTGLPIGGAVVVALDANDAPISGTATSGTDGGYQLRVIAPRAADGAPQSLQVKLRAAAAGFEPFPSALRRAIPVEIAGAPLVDGKRVFASAGTDVTLTPGPAGLGTISGTVKGDPGKRGALVVADGPAALSAISDFDGAYVIFNVPAGAYTVRGYAAGASLEPAMASVAAGAKITGVDLAVRQAALGSVSGTVEIVDAPGGSMTSVVLVVESTFIDALARGEVPPGLRAPRAGAPSVTGPFTIAEVPEGKYVVLAAFENDGLVRDPDTAIGGTQIQHVQVAAGQPVTLSTGFKVTAGLTVMQPGAKDTPDVVTGTPTFVWKDDASETRYAIEVIDNHGASVWRNDQIPRATGSDVTVGYGGPPLGRGLYQFRVTSFRRDNIPISTTEDLRGVFLVP